MRREKYSLFLMLVLGLFIINVVLNTEGSYRTNKVNEPGFTLKDGSITYSSWNYMNATDYAFQNNEIRNHSSLVKVNLTSISDEILKIEVNIESKLEEAFIIRSDSTRDDPFGYNITMYPNIVDPEQDWEEDFLLPHEISKMSYVYHVDTQKLEDLMEINLFTGSLVLKYVPFTETGGWGAHESLFAFFNGEPKSLIEINAKTWEIGDEYFFAWARKVGWYQQLYLEKYTVTNTSIFQGFDTWILEVLEILEPYKSTTKSFYNKAEYEKNSGILIRHDFKEVREEEGDFRDERQSHIWISNNNLLVVPTNSSTTDKTTSTDTSSRTNESSSSEIVSSLTSSSITPSLNFLLAIFGMILIYRFKKSRN